MRKKLTFNIYWVGYAVLLFLILPLPTSADSLITRDDFLCYDTTLGIPPHYAYAFYHCTAIDGNGNISELPHN